MLATAIWHQSPRLFRYIFLGKMSTSDVKQYWSNARERCPWYPSHIPVSRHGGLVPISIYGDEVNAFRNTEPGAISVLGWSSDFSHGIDALLQYCLLCVYSEYCESETTYDELMEILLPRFMYMCDPQAGHPWQADFQFVFLGVRGDLKWVNDRYKIHNFRKNFVCSRCTACKEPANGNIYESLTCFSDRAQHFQISHESFCDARPIDEWPIPSRFGVRLERYDHDVCHSQLLGTGKVVNGSALTFLCELGFFSNYQFAQGTYDSALTTQLRAAYQDFKTWTKWAKLKCSQPRFTIRRLNRQHRGMQPCFFAIRVCMMFYSKFVGFALKVGYHCFAMFFCLAS